jgi:uncharacterized protein
VKLYPERLTETPTTHEFEGDADWWEESANSDLDIQYTVTRPFHFALLAHTMAENLLIEGTLVGEIEVECSRCISRYRHALREPFRLVLEPARDRSPADPESAAALASDGFCLSDELETGWYRGKELKLSHFLIEVVALALPVQPLCSEDCAGLCPTCGENRNLAACGCEDARPNSPFAALAALRGGSTGGNS